MHQFDQLDKKETMKEQNQPQKDTSRASHFDEL